MAAGRFHYYEAATLQALSCQRARPACGPVARKHTTLQASHTDARHNRLLKSDCRGQGETPGSGANSITIHILAANQTPSHMLPSQRKSCIFHTSPDTKQG